MKKRRRRRRRRRRRAGRQSWQLLKTSRQSESNVLQDTSATTATMTDLDTEAETDPCSIGGTSARRPRRIVVRHHLAPD